MPLFQRGGVLVLAALSWGLLAGCGPKDGVSRASVTGSVTLDGAPVPTGVILFIPQAGVIGPPVQIVIDKGVYRSDAAAGPTIGMNSVQISAVRKTGKIITVEGNKVEETEVYIPKRYNENSELSSDIKAGENKFDFALQSK